jgi:HEAT repeat protein
LIRFAQETDRKAARAAIESICKAKRDSLPMLLLALKYSLYSCDWAIQKLDTMHTSDTTIIRALIGALKNKEPLDREYAAEALGHRTILLEEIIPALVSVLSDEVMIARSAAGESLSKFGPKAVPALLECLKCENIYTKTTAIDALERIQPITSDMEDAFVRCLKDSNSYVRAVSSSILTRIKTEKATAALKIFEEDEHLREITAEKESLQLRNRIFSLQEALSTIPPDADNYNPLVLDKAIPYKDKGDTVFLFAIHKDRDRPDELNIWKKEDSGYRLLETFLTDEGDYHGHFDDPIFFRLEGDRFIYIQNNSSGNGGYHDDSIYFVTDRQDLQHVDFNPSFSECKSLLHDGEVILNGVVNDIEDDKLSFSFGIWEKEDAHCCPSGGEIDGTYKLEKNTIIDPWTKKRRISYKIVIGGFERLPAKEN